MGGGRIESLDAIRGLAASVVVLHHSILVFGDTAPRLIRYPPLRVLFSGEVCRARVFVLSGFVLYLTFFGVDKAEWAPFAVKRALRIWPPFAAAILLAAVLWALTYSGPPSSAYWPSQANWVQAPTAFALLAHLAMTDNDRMQTLDNVMWSLVVELRLSLLCPLIAFAVRRECALRWRAASSFRQGHYGLNTIEIRIGG